jgi:hypothetical protein
MKAIIIALISSLTFNVWQVKAQDENSRKISGNDGKYSLLWAGLETSTTPYINNDTKDSNGVNLYIAPYFNYSHKSGFGIRVKSYMLPGGSNPGFYLTSVSPYFAKYTGKVYPLVSYTRYIQHDNPSVFYSPIQNEFYAHARIKTEYIDPIAGIDIGFGEDEQNNNESVSDVNAFAGLSHLFAWYNLGANKNNALGILPTLQINAGTDRYFKYLRTTKYISQNTKAGRMGYGSGSGGGGNGNQGGNTGAMGTGYTISEENSFALSNFEVNLYVIYFMGKFSFEPSGSLYFPLRGDDRTPYGYWQFNLNYWFK